MADAVDTTKRGILKGLGALPVLAVAPTLGAPAVDADEYFKQSFARAAMDAVKEMARNDPGALARLDGNVMQRLVIAGFSCDAIDASDCSRVVYLARKENAA